MQNLGVNACTHSSKLEFFLYKNCYAANCPNMCVVENDKLCDWTLDVSRQVKSSMEQNSCSIMNVNLVSYIDQSNRMWKLAQEYKFPGELGQVCARIVNLASARDETYAIAMPYRHHGMRSSVHVLIVRLTCLILPYFIRSFSIRYSWDERNENCVCKVPLFIWNSIPSWEQNPVKFYREMFCVLQGHWIISECFLFLALNQLRLSEKTWNGFQICTSSRSCPGLSRGNDL